MNSIVFRADDGPGIGAGHLMRCLALAEAARRQGTEVFLSAARSSPLHARWSAIGAEVLIREREIGSAADAETTLGLVKQAEAGWLVVDSYGFSPERLDQMATASPLLLLDDTGDRDAAVALVLNHNPGAEERYAASYRRCRRALLGTDWFLLRDEWKGVKAAPEPGRILVTLGGSDAQGNALAVMQALLAVSRPWVAEIVAAVGEEGWASLQALAEQHPGRFILSRAPVDLPPRAGRASVVLCAGGVTAVEMASLGVPAVVVPLAENQLPGARALAAAGSIRLVEPGARLMERGAGMTIDLLEDSSARAALAGKGRASIRGNGAERVLKIMQERGE